MCDRNIPTKLKYKTAKKNGHDVWSRILDTYKEETTLHTTEMCILRWAIDKTRSCEKCRHLVRLRGMRGPDGRIRHQRVGSFEYVLTRNRDEATRKILQMTIDGKRNRSRPKLRWRDLVKEDMARN